jgi:hypothetical protein
MIAPGRRCAALLLCLTLFPRWTTAGVGRRSAAYVDGTIKRLNGSVVPIACDLDSSNEHRLRLTATQKPYEGIHLDLEYSRLADVEYWQRRDPGRKKTVGSAGLGGSAISAAVPNKGSHYLMIRFHDAEDNEQMVVLEVGKDAIGTVIKLIETRSGKTVRRATR